MAHPLQQLMCQTFSAQEIPMNSVIYLVGLVVVVAAVPSFVF
jgi:hypothetical protein